MMRSKFSEEQNWRERIAQALVVCGPTEPGCLTGSLNGEAALTDIWATTSRRSAVLRVFAMTSFKAAFSMDRSAYMSLSWPFSCSNSFIRLISDASSPPYLAFHLQ